MASSFPSNSANDSGDACESRGGGFGPGSQRDLSDLKILVTNVHGLRQGCGELSVLATTAAPHLLCVMETHLNGDTGSSFTPAGYVSVARADRSEHGGVLIFSHENLLCDELDTTRYYVREKAELCAVYFSGFFLVFLLPTTTTFMYCLFMTLIIMCIDYNVYIPLLFTV